MCLLAAGRQWLKDWASGKEFNVAAPHSYNIIMIPPFGIYF
jgi:hypothetical protein